MENPQLVLRFFYLEFLAIKKLAISSHSVSWKIEKIRKIKWILNQVDVTRLQC